MKPNDAYKKDRQWSDGFIPAMRTIIGPHLLVPSTFEQDTSEASDLVVLKAHTLTIACRVRRPGFLLYQHEFTIRSQRDNGCQTELEKLVNGWADWMFYAHSNTQENGFSKWTILDLSAWRAHLIRNRQSIRYGQKSNNDGTHFTWFDIRSFQGQPPLIIAQSSPAPLSPIPHITTTTTH